MSTATKAKALPKSHDVIFVNGRTDGRKGTMPWFDSGFTDKYGVTQLFKQIPLYNPDGTPMQYKDKDGKMVARTWEQNLDFGPSSRNLTLNSVTHKDVIKAIRGLMKCRSSKKPEGMVNPTNAWIIEHEPQVIAKQRTEAAKYRTSIYRLLGDLLDNTDKNVYKYVLALTGIYGRNSDGYIPALEEYAKAHPEKLTSLFKNKDKLELKPEKINIAIVNIAIKDQIIVNRGGNFFLDNANLGSTTDQIIAKEALFSKISSLVNG